MELDNTSQDEMRSQMRSTHSANKLVALRVVLLIFSEFSALLTLLLHWKGAVEKCHKSNLCFTIKEVYIFKDIHLVFYFLVT